MSNGVFSSGDLNTAASRRLPAPSDPAPSIKPAPTPASAPLSQSHQSQQMQPSVPSTARPLTESNLRRNNGNIVYPHFAAAASRSTSPPIVNAVSTAVNPSADGGGAPTPLWARFSKTSSSFLNTALGPDDAPAPPNSPTSKDPSPVSDPQSLNHNHDHNTHAPPVSFLKVETVTPPQSSYGHQHQKTGSASYTELPPPTLVISERGNLPNGSHNQVQNGRASIPSLTIKKGDDPFYRPNFDYETKKSDFRSPYSNIATRDTKEKILTPSENLSAKQMNTVAATATGKGHHQTKPPSISMSTRIFSAFRSSGGASNSSVNGNSGHGNQHQNHLPHNHQSNGHGFGKSNIVNVKSVLSTSNAPASAPSHQSQLQRKVSGRRSPTDATHAYVQDPANAATKSESLASPESKRSFSTAREGASDLGHGAGLGAVAGTPAGTGGTASSPQQKEIELNIRLADSGFGNDIVVATAVQHIDKPASPATVLSRTEEPTKPENAVKLIAGEPPTKSGKALDILLGIPNETPAKAISTLTGIKVAKKPDVPTASENFHPRQSMFSIRSEASTSATTYKEGKEDADESDLDTITSTLGPLLPGSLPREKRSHASMSSVTSSLPSPQIDKAASKSAWDKDRERKASAHSTSSDSSAAAVFSPPPPVPSIPSRILATGITAATPLVSPNQQRTTLITNTTPLFRQAVTHTQSKRPDNFYTTIRPGSRDRDIAHDAMTGPGDEPPKTATGISIASFENAISEGENSAHPTPRASDVDGRDDRLPTSGLELRNKAKPTSRAAKRTSKAFSEAPSVVSQVSANPTLRDGPRKTLASLYLVAGLPKDPNNWSLAENDTDSGSSEPAHMENAVPRWFKAEVLGTMVSGGGETALDALEGFQGRNVNGSKAREGKKTKGKNAKSTTAPMTTIEEQPTLSKEEIAKIQAKAIKLSLPRDVEIIAAGTAPPATSHTFSFTIKAHASENAHTGSVKGALGASWDLALAQAARPTSTDRDDTTYYGASLIVWTHADKTRTDAIRAAIEVGSKVRSLAIARAAKAAAAGRRFGERLARQQASPLGSAGSASRGRGPGNATSGGETEVETEAYIESEWEGGGAAPLNASAAKLPFLKSSTFWLPYALTLVSKYPIYDLLTDTLRLSWARYHLNISRHSLTMRKLLEFPAPRPSERFKIPVDPLADAEGAFVMRFPGKVSMNSITADIDFQLWPVLRCLDADNVLRIAEIALSPFGRVIFFCQHVYMLNLAIETFRHLLEPRGWKGIMHGVVHARDIKVYVEDPGPFLIGVDSRCINLAKGKMDPDICYVDLETNDVRCQTPPPGALFRGAQREKLVKKLAEAIGNVGYYGVPVELTDAFPGSRFRPFSQVEVNGRVAPAERLLPPSNWNYNQERFLAVFDMVISIRPDINLIQRILHLKNGVRKAAELSTNAQHVQQIVRNQSSNFVDKRDLMEAKLWRMNKRLALLMQESQSWNSQFTHFQGFTEKLNAEAQELRTKLEKERREAKRLSGVVSESKAKQDDLSKKLVQAEAAHIEAVQEMERIEDLRRELQEQRDIMFTEMAALASAAEDTEMLEAIALKLETRSETWSARSRPSLSVQRKLSSRQLRASSIGAGGHSDGRSGDRLGLNGRLSRSRRLSTASNGTTPTLTDLTEQGDPTEGEDENEEEDQEELDLLEDEEYLEASAMQRMAISETMRSIQEKLQSALANAQARARNATLLSPPPSTSWGQGQGQGNGQQQVSRPGSSLSQTQTQPPSAGSPTTSTHSNGGGDTPGLSHPLPAAQSGTFKSPHLPTKKKKSRTVVGHPGRTTSSRKVEVPSSASESEDVDANAYTDSKPNLSADEGEKSGKLKSPAFTSIAAHSAPLKRHVGGTVNKSHVASIPRRSLDVDDE